MAVCQAVRAGGVSPRGSTSKTTDAVRGVRDLALIDGKCQYN
jgi:hypothetical protein